MLLLVALVVVLLLGLNVLRYRHDIQLRNPAAFARSQKLLPVVTRVEEPMVSVSVAETHSGDGRIGQESELRMLPSPRRVLDPRISTSEELIERLKTDDLHVILPFDRVLELRKARNGGYPRKDMIAPVIDGEYSVLEAAMPPELAVESTIEPWEHDVIAMAS